MARTLEDIENEILTAKENDPVLQSAITTSSRFSVWGAIVYVMAYVMYALEQLFVLFKADITEIVTNNRIGSLAWYAQISKAFQLGDTLNEDLTYNTPNPGLQIITRVAVKENPDGSLDIKLAQGDSQETLAPLTAEEETQFEAYLEKVKPAGVKTNVISIEPDQVILTSAEVFYNPIHTEGVIASRLLEAVNDYCNRISFGGAINKNDLIGRVRQEEGIEDFVINTLDIDRNGGITTVTRAEELEAGYAVFDETRTGPEPSPFHNISYTPV